MRKCPVCQMTVDAKNECPICAATLTYEPVCDAEREHLLWNRYRWLYIAKCTWFSFLCCLIGLLKVIIARPQFHLLFWMAAALAAVSLAVSLFQRQIFRLLTWKYSENYAAYEIAVFKYGFGSISLILFLLL